VTSADFQASDCSAYNVCTTTAPFAYVTTRTFLEAFGFASLRDLPDLERLTAEGLLERGHGEDDLDNVLGLADDEGEAPADDAELERADRYE
jgi:segregation and condensation protein B